MAVKYLLTHGDTYYTVVKDKAFVDSIIFTGHQLIRTGIIPNQDTKVEISLNTSTFNDAALIGSRKSTSKDKFGIFLTSATQMHGQYGTQSITETVDDYTGVDVTVSLSKDGLSRDGVVIATFDEAEFTAPGEMTIGTFNTNGTLDSRFFSGTIYSVSIWQGEEEVLHLIPCVDEAVKPCFYDTLSESCYYNDGSGTFGFDDAEGKVDTATSLVALEETEITAEVFRTYGIEDASLITAKLVSEWTAFKVLKWTDGDTITLTATLTDTTPLPQIIISNAIYLDDPSILGIESVTATYEGNPKVAMSFDDKTTWYIYTDGGWGTLSDDTAGMSMDTLIAITTEQWAEKITDLEKMYMRVVLSALEDKVTEIYFDFVN